MNPMLNVVGYMRSGRFYVQELPDKLLRDRVCATLRELPRKREETELRRTQGVSENNCAPAVPSEVFLKSGPLSEIPQYMTSPPREL